MSELLLRAGLTATAWRVTVKKHMEPDTYVVLVSIGSGCCSICLLNITGSKTRIAITEMVRMVWWSYRSANEFIWERMRPAFTATTLAGIKPRNVPRTKCLQKEERLSNSSKKGSKFFATNFQYQLSWEFASACDIYTHLSNGAELGFGGLGFTDGGQQHSIFIFVLSWFYSPQWDRNNWCWHIDEPVGKNRCDP